METEVRDDSRLSALRNIRRRSVDSTSLDAVKSYTVPDVGLLPLVIEPTDQSIDLPTWAGANRDWLNDKLAVHGALLFRGFDMPDLTRFEDTAAAISDELFAEYGDLPREGQGGKVYTSTPYPEDQYILFHNESSHLSTWPMKIFFHCVTPAAEGGNTPIVDCRRMYEALDPELREIFERKGLRYVRNFIEGLDVKWQRFFDTDDKAHVEKWCADRGASCIWKGENDLQTIQQRTAVSEHPKTGEKLFFNQVQLHHIHCLDPDTKEAMLMMFERDDLPRHVYFGDGSEIPDDVMDKLGETYWKVAVQLPWQKGDIFMLDNMMAAHARCPYKPPRKIVVALGELTGENVEAMRAYKLN